MLIILGPYARSHHKLIAVYCCKHFHSLPLIRPPSAFDFCIRQTPFPIRLSLRCTLGCISNKNKHTLRPFLHHFCLTLLHFSPLCFTLSCFSINSSFSCIHVLIIPYTAVCIPSLAISFTWSLPPPLPLSSFPPSPLCYLQRLNALHFFAAHKQTVPLGRCWRALSLFVRTSN